MNIICSVRIIFLRFSTVGAFAAIFLCAACDNKPTTTQNDQPTAASPISTTVTRSPATALTPGNPLTFNASNNFERIQAGANATLSRSSDGLVVRALNNDPILSIPPLEVTRGTRVNVHIQLISPAATTLEIFYNTTNTPDFDAQHSVRKPIQQGDNDVTVELSDPNFAGRLRLDPGELAGDYTIKLVEITAFSRNSPSESSSPSATP